MSNKKINLDSGATVEIQVASFEKSHRLLQAVKASMIPMESLIDLIVSPTVQPSLWECLACCLYNDQKIDRLTFDQEEARGDYLVVAKEALVANLRPFFKSLASKSLDGLAEQK